MLKHMKRNLVAFAAGSMLIGSANAFVVNEEFTGNYFEEGKSGRGVIVDIVPSNNQEFGNAVIAQWFTFRDGAPLWLTGFGSIDQNTNIAELDFYELEGGSFGPEFTEDDASQEIWGTGTLSFDSCDQLTLDYNGDDGTGTLDLSPVSQGAECIVKREFEGCPDFASAGPLEGSCIVGGEVNSDIALSNEITWLIQGQLIINDGASLTIEPNTELVGGTLGDTDTLVVKQGGQIFAEGTASNPIIMRGPDAATRAEWGGVVINGFAPINGCSEGTDPCTAQGEGNSGTYGGNDPHDNSGVMRYMVVSNAGRQFSEENELNGIAFQGVGDGTTVEYIQVHLNEDDGVEFFGGTVNAKYLVLTGIGDDSLDWTQGWQGKAQFVLAKQYTDNGDQGIEADNNGDANDSTPRAKPMLANMTYIGQSNTDIGILLREGTGANIANTVVTGFGEFCLDIDNESTFENEENLTIENSVVGGCGETFSEDGEDLFSVSNWFFSFPGNVEANPRLSNYAPNANSPAIGIGAVPFEDDFFDNVDYAGAISGTGADWTRGWTVGLDRTAPLGQ
ncbi:MULTISPECIES: hypothetical protein [unclassified Wenzhouxiangella]|uniref:hypothetical protein n=1 Tax=unclassified Wenzhouxiangella TaxID=2613841 RepID=UPI000E328B0F|nr:MULTISPECIES: hypothetical protein [unclassified Wenzhouxiangella]RFF26869.1 hypothetical protein DZK25_10925 [Wenzhouxiangella sp. 15181]